MARASSGSLVPPPGRYSLQVLTRTGFWIPMAGFHNVTVESLTGAWLLLKMLKNRSTAYRIFFNPTQTVRDVLPAPADGVEQKVESPEPVRPADEEG